MPSGVVASRMFRLLFAAGAQPSMSAVPSSTLSSTSCAVARRGVCCPKTCRPGNWRITTSVLLLPYYYFRITTSILLLPYYYFRNWTQEGWWEHVHALWRAQVRAKADKKSQPSAGVLDSQTVSCVAPGGERGYDAGKKIKGRKRHAVVDTLGLLWLLVVHPAHIQDRDSAKLLLARLAFCLFRWRLLWADGAYAGALEQWVAALRVPRPGWCPLRLEIVRRCDGAKGWQLLPKRWIVERTFGWLARSRRLARDYETNIQHSQSMVYAAMIHLMLRRLNNQGTF